MAFLHPKCKTCTHPDVDTIDEDRLIRRMPLTKLAAKWYPTSHQPTAVNNLQRHYKKHRILAVPTIQQAALLPPPSATGCSPQRLAISTERVFARAQKENINASANLEKMMLLLMEKINLLEDEFMGSHFETKCDSCGRAGDQGQNLSKVLSCVREVRELNGEWVKIKNPKEVVKYFFNSTFVKFVDLMTAYYMDKLQEKARMVRGATGEFVEGRINATLFSRRVAEAEDLGATGIAEHAVQEMKKILEAVGKEMDKGTFA